MVKKIMLSLYFRTIAKFYYVRNHILNFYVGRYNQHKQERFNHRLLSLLFGHEFVLCKLVNPSENTPDLCHFYPIEKDRTGIAVKPNAAGNENRIFKEITLPPSYWVCITNANISGGSNLILNKDQKCGFFPYYFFDMKKKFRYTDEQVKCIKNGYAAIPQNKKDMDMECGIWLGGNFSFNYYHFLFEFMTKFMVIEKMNLPRSIPLIVDDVFIKTPQFSQIISLFNTDKRTVVAIAKNKSCLVKKLYSPAFVNFIPPNYHNIKQIEYDDSLFDKTSLDYLRKKLLVLKNDKKTPDKIFLSRKNYARRQYNEADVFSVLEPYGFVSVDPGTLDIEEQITYFNNARFIVGTSGAAFSNILFCQAGCTILCLTSYIFDLSIFSTISDHVNARLYYLPSKHVPPNCIQNPFIVDIKELKKNINRIIPQN